MEHGSLAKAFLQSERSTTELAGPSNRLHYEIPNKTTICKIGSNIQLFYLEMQEKPDINLSPSF